MIAKASLLLHVVSATSVAHVLSKLSGQQRESSGLDMLVGTTIAQRFRITGKMKWDPYSRFMNPEEVSKGRIHPTFPGLCVYCFH